MPIGIDYDFKKWLEYTKQDNLKNLPKSDLENSYKQDILNNLPKLNLRTEQSNIYNLPSSGVNSMFERHNFDVNSDFTKQLPFLPKEHPEKDKPNKVLDFLRSLSDTVREGIGRIIIDKQLFPDETSSDEEILPNNGQAHIVPGSGFDKLAFPDETSSGNEFNPSTSIAELPENVRNDMKRLIELYKGQSGADLALIDDINKFLNPGKTTSEEQKDLKSKFELKIFNTTLPDKFKNMTDVVHYFMKSSSYEARAYVLSKAFEQKDWSKVDMKKIDRMINNNNLAIEWDNERMENLQKKGYANRERARVIYAYIDAEKSLMLERQRIVNELEQNRYNIDVVRGLVEEQYRVEALLKKLQVEQGVGFLLDKVGKGTRNLYDIPDNMAINNLNFAGLNPFNQESRRTLAEFNKFVPAGSSIDFETATDMVDLQAKVTRLVFDQIAPQFQGLIELRDGEWSISSAMTQQDQARFKALYAETLKAVTKHMSPGIRALLLDTLRVIPGADVIADGENFQVTIGDDIHFFVNGDYFVKTKKELENMKKAHKLISQEGSKNEW